MIARTPRGRVALDAAYEHIGLRPPHPPAGSPGLFD
jgi:Holliday junction DNA helicase RuvB